jgi:D-inositol-3-phosphate glycosyltransferase
MRLTQQIGPAESAKFVPASSGVELAGDASIAGPDVPSRVSLLTGGGDKPYAFGLAASLIAQGVPFDFIGSDEVDGSELNNSLVRFFNLRGDMSPQVSAVKKVFRIFQYYGRLLRYALTAKPKLFHILWNNKFAFVDRVLLLLFYRALGKHIVFTAHNVNAGRRDGNNTVLNRLTLKFQYHLVDHIFVHTEQMKAELGTEFNINHEKVTVIPFGINSTVPDTALTSLEARRQLGLSPGQKVILFFGNIAPYKGLEYLIEAFAKLAVDQPEYRLVIAGRPKCDEAYWKQIRDRLSAPELSSGVIERIEYVPDADTEIYFKAADLLALPYTHIFQSGVLFLGYNFGLPVIASDVGSLKEDIIEGTTGLVCSPKDPADLAGKMAAYFTSDLYRQLETRRQDIREFAHQKYSWSRVAELTKAVYDAQLERK